MAKKKRRGNEEPARLRIDGAMVSVWMDGKQPKERVVFPLDQKQLLDTLRCGCKGIPSKGVEVALDHGFHEDLGVLVALVWDEDITMETYEALR